MALWCFQNIAVCFRIRPAQHSNWLSQWCEFGVELPDLLTNDRERERERDGVLETCLTTACFNTLLWQFVTILHFSELVVILDVFPQSYLYVFIRSAYSPLTLLFRGGPLCLHFYFSLKIVSMHIMLWNHKKITTFRFFSWDWVGLFCTSV